MLRFIEIALYKLQIITNIENVTIKILNSTLIHLLYDHLILWNDKFFEVTEIKHTDL